MTIRLTVNGAARETTAAPETPLIYVLRNDFGLNGPKYGCGQAQCGACAVLIDGREALSCVTPVGDVGAAPIVTLEGLGTIERPHPIQQAFVDEQAAQCGYCSNGMIIAAKDLLEHNPAPGEAQIRSGLAGHLCRCGAHNRIVRAILRAAQQMRRR